MEFPKPLPPGSSSISIIAVKSPNNQIYRTTVYAKTSTTFKINGCSIKDKIYLAFTNYDNQYIIFNGVIS